MGWVASVWGLMLPGSGRSFWKHGRLRRVNANNFRIGEQELHVRPCPQPGFRVRRYECGHRGGGKESLIPLFNSFLGNEHGSIVTGRGEEVAGMTAFKVINTDHTLIMNHRDACRGASIHSSWWNQRRTTSPVPIPQSRNRLGVK